MGKSMVMADPDNFHTRDWDFVEMEQSELQAHIQ
jgi:hypothetical protein